MAVDGSVGDLVGVVWSPRTPVGAGDGEAVALAVAVAPGELDATGVDPVLVATGVALWPATDGGGDDAAVFPGVGDAATLAEGVDPDAAATLVAVADGTIVPDGAASGPPISAARTIAASASAPAAVRIGTSPNRGSLGRCSRQFGQKPDTGVVTKPQFRHRAGRRSRAIAWLAAFRVRNRF